MTESQSARSGSSNNAEYQAVVTTAQLDHNSLRQVPGLCGPPTPSQSSRSKPEEDHASPGEDSLTSIMPLEQSSWEYHGPFSYISICSGRGIEWVNKRCGMPGFAQISRAFIQEISDTIKLQQPLSSERAPEPDPETTWRYSNLFFDHCPEASFGVIRREDFERRLRYHYDKTPPAPADDDDGFEWYALLNVVLAFGARIQNGTAGSSLTFLDCTEAGARYFGNALSKLPDMLYLKIGLVAVQAIVLMVRCPHPRMRAIADEEAWADVYLRPFMLKEQDTPTSSICSAPTPYESPRPRGCTDDPARLGIYNRAKKKFAIRYSGRFIYAISSSRPVPGAHQ